MVLLEGIDDPLHRISVLLRVGNEEKLSTLGRHFGYSLAPRLETAQREASSLHLSNRLLSIESSPYLREAPSGLGGHKVSWSGCRRDRRFVEQLQGWRLSSSGAVMERVP
jgi:hypothetical protein